MKYALLRYDHQSANLGDTIQSLAARQFLPRVDKTFDRDTLGLISEQERFLIIMNGYFSASPANWPPSKAFLPVFIGFHIARWAYVQRELLSEKSVEYLKQNEPIGCRDRTTAKMLSKKGVKTFYSKCLTLTFPKRQSEPENGMVFLVDASDIPMPESIERASLSITHEVSCVYDDNIKTQMAEALLDTYKKEARLVITTKLHCALPCIALGVPVIFFGDPKLYRTSLLEDLGVRVYKKPNLLVRDMYRYARLLRSKSEGKFILDTLSRAVLALSRRMLVNSEVDWDPKPVDIECEKTNLIERTREMVRRKVEATCCEDRLQDAVA